jgi:hypothetical protein
MAVFSDVAPCSLIDVDRRFRGAHWFQDDRPHDEVRTSETSVSIYQTIRRNIPEDSHLHTSRRENLKPHHLVPIVFLSLV